MPVSLLFSLRGYTSTSCRVDQDPARRSEQSSQDFKAGKLAALLKDKVVVP